MVTFEVDNSPSLVINAYVFRYEKWITEGSEEDGTLSVKGIPGTWDFPHWEQLKPVVHALVCCPNCHQVNVLLKRVTSVDRIGHLDPHFACTYVDSEQRRCEFHRDSYLDEWNSGQFLYALSYHSKQGIRIIYTHANSMRDAARAFPNIPQNDIIAIGRAVGFAGQYADAQTLKNAETPKN